jgi:hypothetical protein
MQLYGYQFMTYMFTLLLFILLLYLISRFIPVFLKIYNILLVLAITDINK